MYVCSTSPTYKSAGGHLGNLEPASTVTVITERQFIEDISLKRMLWTRGLRESHECKFYGQCSEYGIAVGMSALGVFSLDFPLMLAKGMGWDKQLISQFYRSTFLEAQTWFVTGKNSDSPRRLSRVFVVGNSKLPLWVENKRLHVSGEAITRHRFEL